MYSCVVESRVKGDAEYDWLRYSGKSMEIPFRGIARTLEPGQIIGVRPSSNGKQIRMVFQNDINRVMTIDLATAKKIAKSVKIVKG